jgi:hypothetical protein
MAEHGTAVKAPAIKEENMRYESPVIVDHGDIAEITAGCVGGIPEDAMAGADTEAFPANSGIFCE